MLLTPDDLTLTRPMKEERLLRTLQGWHHERFQGVPQVLPENVKAGLTPVKEGNDAFMYVFGRNESNIERTQALFHLAPCVTRFIKSQKQWAINVHLESFCPVLGRVPAKLVRCEDERVELKLWGMFGTVHDLVVPDEACTVSSLPDNVIVLEGKDAQDVLARRFDITHGSELMLHKNKRRYLEEPRDAAAAKHQKVNSKAYKGNEDHDEGSEDDDHHEEQQVHVKVVNPEVTRPDPRKLGNFWEPRFRRVNLPELDEQYNRDILVRLSLIKGLEPSVRSTIHRALRQTCQSGQTKVTYRAPRKNNTGRLYASHGAQHFPRHVRRLVMGDLYYDVDMVNSGPTLLWNLCQAHGLLPTKYSAIEWIVLRRDEAIRHVMDCIRVQPSYDKAKQVINRLMQLGGFGDEVDPTPPLQRLQAQVRSAWQYIVDTGRYRNVVRADVEQIQAILFLVGYQDILFFHEGVVLDTCIRYAREHHDAQVGTMMYDGFLVMRSGRCEEDMAVLMRGMEVYVYAELGFAVRFKVKDMVPTPEDWLFLAQPAHSIGSGSFTYHLDWLPENFVGGAA